MIWNHILVVYDLCIRAWAPSLPLHLLTYIPSGILGPGWESNPITLSLHPFQQHWQLEMLNTLRLTSMALSDHSMHFMSLSSNTFPCSPENRNCTAPTHVNRTCVQKPSLRSSHLSRQVQQQALGILGTGRVLFVHRAWCLAWWGPLVSAPTIISY